MKASSPYSEPLFCIGVGGSIVFPLVGIIFQFKYGWGWPFYLAASFFAIAWVIGVKRWQRRPH